MRPDSLRWVALLWVAFSLSRCMPPRMPLFVYNVDIPDNSVMFLLMCNANKPSTLRARQMLPRFQPVRLALDFCVKQLT